MIRMPGHSALATSTVPSRELPSTKTTSWRRSRGSWAKTLGRLRASFKAGMTRLTRGDEEAIASISARGTYVALGQGAAQLRRPGCKRSGRASPLGDRKAIVMGDGAPDPDSDVCSVL